MEFNLTAWFLNPFVLLFAASLSGLIFGKMGIGRFKFGVSGALFTGLIFGKLSYGFALNLKETDIGYEAAKALLESGVIGKSLFQLFLILFVASVGLLASGDIGFVFKKYGLKFMVLGLAVTFIGAAASYGAASVSPFGNSYEMAGVYTGALTSSPGFAAAVETAGRLSAEQAENYSDSTREEKAAILSVLDPSKAMTPENTPELTEEQERSFSAAAEMKVGVGNALAYPFGVLIVILAMNFLPGILRIDLEREKQEYRKEIESSRLTEAKTSAIEGDFDVPAFILICLTGYTLGQVGFPAGSLGVVTLGSTGGVLALALFFGHKGKLGSLNFRMDKRILGNLREVSLVFFLAIVGLRNGYGAFEALDASGLRIAFSSVFVGLTAMTGGILIGRHVFKINWIMLSGAICGGMTSTPGLGAAIDAAKSDDPAAGYGATYPFALIGMVVFTLALHRLPL